MERIKRAWAVGIGVQRGDVPSRRVKNSDWARPGEDGRRWLKRVRIGAWVGGMRRTRRPMVVWRFRYIVASLKQRRRAFH